MIFVKGVATRLPMDFVVVFEDGPISGSSPGALMVRC
jgi:hypothetical protein